ncbi:Glucose dehydrogenase [FAD, quinone], partial [Gryllus bimaculatus]
MKMTPTNALDFYAMQERDCARAAHRAGGDEPPRRPGAVHGHSTTTATDLDWQYETASPRPAPARASPAKRLPSAVAPGRRAIGVTHGMMYTAWSSTVRDYDELAGCPRMAGPGASRPTHATVYDLKSEDNTETRRVARRYHGVGGPLTVQRFPAPAALRRTSLRAGARELGLPFSDTSTRPESPASPSRRPTS